MPWTDTRLIQVQSLVERIHIVGAAILRSIPDSHAECLLIHHLLVVPHNGLISIDGPLLLNNVLLVILLLLLLYDIVEQILTGLFVHLENSRRHDLTDLLAGQVVQQIPVLKIGLLLFHGSTRILCDISPLSLGNHFLIGLRIILDELMDHLNSFRRHLLTGMELPD